MRDKIEEIRARHEAGPRPNLPIRAFATPDEIEFAKADADRAFLLAEVKRQRAENERLKNDLAVQRGCCDGAAAQDAHVCREREEHRAEVERLRAKIDGLEAELSLRKSVEIAYRVMGDKL